MKPFRVLLAVDGSHEAAGAQLMVRSLPLPEGSTIHVLSVISDLSIGHHVSWKTVERVVKHDEERARVFVREAGEMLARSGVEVTTSVRRGDPASEIIRAAEEFNVDLVVLGSRGRTGLEGFLLGSVARNVAYHCRRPVLVARFPRDGIREVVVGIDGSEQATAAAEFVARLPLPEEAQITLVEVVQAYEPFADLLTTDREAYEAALVELGRQQEESGRGALTAAQVRLAELGRVTRTELRAGDPATEILHLADERRADLIAVASRGRSLIEGLLVGSVADRLLKEARCSVLVVH